MSNETHAIHGHDSLIAMSRVTLDIATSDATADGYLEGSGRNREIGIALGTHDEVIIYMVTNGGDIALPDAADGAPEWLRDMGDSRPDLDETEEEEHARRIDEGIERVRDAITEITNRYNAENENVAGSIEFYEAILADVSQAAK